MYSYGGTWTRGQRQHINTLKPAVYLTFKSSVRAAQRTHFASITIAIMGLQALQRHGYSQLQMTVHNELEMMWKEMAMV
jgi:hypothetical protein